LGLSPEERRKIYEEEKAKIEAEEKQEEPKKEASGHQLPENVAGLLCYLGMWITGIVFLVIEPKNRFIRFHALQSIIVFGVLMVLSGFFGMLPVFGVFLTAAIGVLALILWIVLMIKAYQGELYKAPIAGDVASSILNSGNKGR